MTCMVFINSKVKLFNVESNDGKTNYKVDEDFVKKDDDKKLEEGMQESTHRTPTPKLLTHTHSVPYNENFEVKLAEKERLRCLNRGSAFPGLVSDTSEIQKIFKRRKKKGHNWTRRKGAKSVPRYSRSTSRKRQTSFSTISPLSHTSLTNSRRGRSSTRRTSSATSSTVRERLSSRWTRSVSRIHEEENKYMSNLLHCSIEECNIEFDDVDSMNEHNIEEHKIKPNYYCYECKEVYTSAKLLSLHNEDHYTSSVFCLMCGIEQSNTRELQKHLDEHMIYSVPCKYCDKSFLSKSIREKHVENCHKVRRKRLIFRDKLILDKIEKDY
ncbi:uncharacterized protein LOC130447159 isoform X1 [Diorhabda sublineata]|uniref:uncharacterized protein LOC130447159 isoform X1 n=1 Tax=Diorhabda sublineata TaxID=1163346 RepID=UPI0024E0FDAD|nr:uncharacterized protein LOC130447159 isoform X1 [Diorhabda sublineata]